MPRNRRGQRQRRSEEPAEEGRQMEQGEQDGGGGDLGMQREMGKIANIIRAKEKEPGQPISEYILYFKRVMKVNRWEDEIAGEIFSALLGPKDRSLDSLEGKWTGFRELEKLLVKKQEPMREAYLDELMHLKLKEGEGIEDFRNRTAHLVSLVYGNFDCSQQSQIVRDNLLYGLPDELRKQVLAGRAKGLEETISLIASCLSLSKNQNRSCFDVDALARNRRDSQRRIKCWSCGKEGHTQRFCRNFKERNFVNNTEHVGEKEFNQDLNGQQLC